MLTAGSTADRIGARKVFAAGLTAFAVGSAACAAAPSLGVLIAARAVQGLGASALLPCSLALLVHQFPDPRSRARALGGLTADFITAGQVGWLSSAPGSLLAAGAAAACLFVRAERRRTSPMLPLALFRSRNLTGATAIGVTARLGPRPPMLAGLTLAALGAAVLATAGTGTPLAIIVGGSVLLGLVSLAMPAMSAAVVGAVRPEHAGVASGILNAARQSGGALGVALLGSLLGGAGSSPGRALSRHVPLAVAAGAYLIALAPTRTAIRPDHDHGRKWPNTDQNWP